MSRWVRRYKAKDGNVTWRAYAREGAGRDARQVHLGTFSSEQDARDAAAAGVDRLRRGGIGGDGAETLRAYSEALLREGHWRSLSETEAVRSRLRTHVWSQPSVADDENSRPLGDLPLDEITRQHIKGLINRLAAKGRALPVRPPGKTTSRRRGASEASAARLTAAPRPLSPKTIRNVHATLSSVLKAAVDDERIPANPAAGVPLPELVDRVKPSLDSDSARLLLKTFATEHTWWLPLVAADLELGCRWGEIIGLRAGDFKGGKIHVARVVGESTVAGVERAVREGRLDPASAHGRYYLKDYTKTRSDRLVAVSRAFANLWQQVIDERELEAGDFVFRTPGGGFPSRATFLSDVFRPALRQAGLNEALRVHDLRGACASLLLANGSETLYVMGRQGWRSVQTVARYRQVLPEDEEKATSLFDGLLADGRC